MHAKHVNFLHACKSRITEFLIIILIFQNDNWMAFACNEDMIELLPNISPSLSPFFQ